MANNTLGASKDNINVQGDVGEETTYVDFGGEDTYTVLSLVGNVTITDNDATTINLPTGLSMDDALFLSNGVQFTINGFTLTMLGAPENFSYVFGGTPLDSGAGTPKTFAETASSFGATIPATGEAPVPATIVGEISADGNVVSSSVGDVTDVSADIGTLTTAESLNASGGAFNFMDNATVLNNVIISNFTSDDTIKVSNATATDYFFSNEGADVNISYNNAGTMNMITLTGVVDETDIIDGTQASFESAIGFDAFIVT